MPGFVEAPAVVNGASAVVNGASAVVNGASDLLVEVFGPDSGGHARISLYQNDLRREAPVACELTLYLGD